MKNHSLEYPLGPKIVGRVELRDSPSVSSSLQSDNSWSTFKNTRALVLLLGFLI